MDGSYKIIEKFISRVRRHLTLHAVTDNVLLGGIAGLLAACIILLVSVFVPWYSAPVWAACAAAAFVPTGIIRGVLSAPDMTKAALAADRAHGGESIVTAHELAKSDSDNPYSALVREEAKSVIQGFRIRYDIPYKWNRRRLLAFGAAAVLCVVIACIDSPARDRADYNHSVRERADETAEQIEKIAEDIEQTADVSSEANADILQELADSVDELEAADSLRDISSIMDRTYLKLAEAAKSTDTELSRASEAGAESLMKEKQESISNMTREALDALKKAENGSSSDSKTAKQKLSDLAETVGDSGLSAAADSYSESDGTGTAARSAQSAVNKATASIAADSGSSQDNADSAGSTESQSGTDSKSSSGTRSESSGQSSSDRQSTTGNQDGSSGQNGTNGQSGTNGGGSNGKNGSNGNGSGGTGWNRGSTIGQETAADNSEKITVPDGELGDDENLTGTNNGGATYSEKSSRSKAWAGSKVDYGDVTAEYSQKAYQQIESADYPGSMKDKIRSYFEGFN